MGDVKLKRLKIEKYRNVAPGTELVFNDGFNVLLGQNGTGKTTLLNLIAMVVASRFGSLKETEFALEYTLEHAGARVNVTIGNKREDSPQPFDESFSWYSCVVLMVGEPPETWTARATTKELLVFAGEQPNDVVSRPTVNPFERNLLSQALLLVMHMMSKEHRSKYTRATFDLMGFEIRNIAQCRRFDELLGGLDSISGAINSNDAPAAAFQFVRYAKDASIRKRDRSIFIPEQLEPIMKAHDPSSRSLDGIKAKHKEVAFLGEAVRLMGFKGADMLLRLRKREPVEDGERLTFSEFEFTITLDDETIIPHGALSYGQKRLLAFLYYVAANKDVIIADEIVNGMHYDWIEACLREIGDRQSFLTSQNPLLLDFLPFKSEQDVEHTFILCGNEERDGRRHMIWKNMPEEDAHTFFRSYKTQALQVSEILRSRGWW